MVLLLEDDVVMKRLFCYYCCVDAVSWQCEIKKHVHITYQKIKKLVEAASSTFENMVMYVDEYHIKEELQII
jgi:hypothetical protein